MPCEAGDIADTPHMVKSYAAASPSKFGETKNYEECTVNWELFSAYCLAVVVLGLLPGPAVGAITATGLAHGTRAAMLVVGGTMVAVVIQMSLIVSFTTSFLDLISEWLPLIRWGGVAYLLYLGFEAFRSAGKDESASAVDAPSQAGFALRGFLVNISNPKALGFFVAFFPQFIDTSLPLVFQMAVLAISYFAIMSVIDSSWAIAGGRANHLLQSKRARMWRDRVSGSFLIGAAVALASVRKG